MNSPSGKDEAPPGTKRPRGGAVYRFAKRIIDIACSLAALLALSPLLLAVALAIRIGSRGPSFYRGVRIGLHGKPFRIFKFRTMVLDADRLGGKSAPTDDPRITRLGALLRRLKIDELPQFLNVLWGTMSLVGPRPQVAEEVVHYTEAEREILSVKPGITDFASIRFHNEGELLKGHADPDQAYAVLIRPEKMRLALEYVRTRSLFVDFKILCVTVATVVGTRWRHS